MLTQATALVLMLGSGALFGCDCTVLPAREAKRDANVVFRGTVVGYRDSGKGWRLVAFRVARVWKGPVTAEFEMPAIEGDSCIAFRLNQLRIGNELVVYASKIGGDYLPQPCNTDLVTNISDIKKLGEGRRPAAK